MKTIERFEIEVNGAKGYLAPLTFAVAEAALGFYFAARPKYLTAGGIILDSLWVRGSKELKKGGQYYDEACLQVYNVINGLDYELKDGVLKIPHYEVLKDGKKAPKIYTCKIKESIERDTLEECLGLIMPTIGNAQPLTAGKLMLKEAWIEGDEEIKKNEELLVSACLACYYLVKLKGGTLKKL